LKAIAQFQKSQAADEDQGQWVAGIQDLYKAGREEFVKIISGDSKKALQAFFSKPLHGNELAYLIDVFFWFFGIFYANFFFSFTRIVVEP
jgi:hypothetical protein